MFLAVGAVCLLQPLRGHPQDADEINRIADMMVRLCVGGGHTETVSGAGGGGADLSLRSLDVKGNLKGEFKISKSTAEGLSNGIDNAMSQVAADQADKVRACLKPVRERLLDVMLPRSPSGMHNPPKPVVTAWIGSWSSEEVNNPAWLFPSKYIVALEQMGPSIVGSIKVGQGWFEMKDLKLTDESISFYIQSELTSSQGKEAYREQYYGVRKGNAIQFRIVDDIGSQPFKFVATRLK